MSELMRSADRREDTNFDKIWRWYYEPAEIELNGEQEKLRLRWDHIWKLMGNFLSPTQIIKKQVKEYPDITERTAWMDLRNAKALFGDPTNQNRMAERLRLNEWIIKGLETAFLDGDLKSYARLIDQYRKNNLLDKDESDSLADLLKYFQPHTFVLTDKGPDELKKEADELMKDVPAVDADYTIVSEDESEAG
ncbi:MAG: hypothetical protein HWE07_09195 [Cytophagia bacterium]|nr:hypothetical protein [Cytophagia bacterium]